jgi:hypothetical protein
MLIDLHNAISNVCPIVGLADLGAGNYRIDFAEEATPEQQAAAWAALAAYEPSNPPNWEQFRAQILFNGGYLRIVSSDPLNGVLNSALVWTLGQLEGNPNLVGEVANLWNAMLINVPATNEEATAFRTIAISCNLPFEVDEVSALITLP